ncbi:hypothetical protein UFOVP1290_174 [uncultured Caudovirales phage]|uniref:Uncharacterized protein n=1 Tax=uncultured Caudovirales phage TaxID=2100421 RepID=A0A6J5RXB8_9CAUD|nr:hypothetical protein UFOVP1290_174 [uncultured Caudovirales phage]
MNEKLPNEPETVPTIALKLFAASVESTNKVTDYLLESKDKEIAKLRSERDQLLQDSLAVQKMHTLLNDPAACRVLMRLIAHSCNFKHEDELDVANFIEPDLR